MKIKFTLEDFRVLDEILYKCETFATRRVEELGCEGIISDPNYVRVCDLMEKARLDKVDYKIYFEIVALVDKVDTRWGW